MNKQKDSNLLTAFAPNWKALGILFLLWCVAAWINSGETRTIDSLGRHCHSWPYGVAWRSGHLPELLIEGECI